MWVSINNKQKGYAYGLRVRPFSLGAQPKGHFKYLSPQEAQDEMRHLKQFGERDYRFGILYYNEPLSDRDIEHYSLTDLNVESNFEKWKKFVEFAKQMKEYDVDYSEFVADYIHPKGPLRENNPLNYMDNKDFFSLLNANTGYSANLEGLKKFYLALR